MQCFRFMALAGVWSVAIAPFASAEPIDFGRDIRPVLASKCFKCHGPDDLARQAGLRLDTFEGATMVLKSGAPAIVPGDASQGSFFARITTHDEVDRMPPPEMGPPLDEATVSLLRQWIAEGAVYEPHWSFVKPEKAPLPAAGDPLWPRNGIDHFIAKGVSDLGLSHAPEADRYTLIRRLYLDLIGLPPTPAQVEAFVNDPSPVAYEKVVEELLASPRYGERWARIWLDIARYADTKGYEADRHRDMWRYRDWVIDAFNQDMPFTEFTIEQFAGDLLPGATMEQQLATAFHRNTMTNDEGGTDNEEFRTAAVLDRTIMTVEAWMGLTMGCAQCHTHKYDPITRKEFYQFYAFLNQTQDADLFPEESPVLPAPTRDQQRELAFLNERLSQLRTAFSEALPSRGPGQIAWEQKLISEGSGAPALSPWESLGPIPQEDFEAGFATDGGLDVTKANLPAPAGYAWTPRPDWADATPIDLDGQGQPAITYLRRTIRAEGPAPYPIKVGSNDAIQIWLNGVEVHTNKALRALTPGEDEVLLNLNAGDNRLIMKITNAGGAYAFSFESAYAGIPLEILDLAARPETGRSADEAATLLAYYRDYVAPELAPLREQIAQLQTRLDEVTAQVPKIPVLRELAPADQRITRMFEKGSFLNPGEEVLPATPAFLHPLPYDAPRNRLGLARWLVDPNNPLTARVLVNRFWAQFFGVGLVETQEDFGTQGELPFNQTLLDWLAVDFMEQGWSMKALCRTIVTSATYRQAAALTPETLEKDPGNRLLARGPRFRLEAEMIRDQALATSGLLSARMYGPSVMPPQPEGLWQVVYSGDQWITAEGEDRYRRGLYTYWRRTSPYPSMITFDAPSREVCTVRRVRTNTPLQALVTLNDPVYVEAAQAMTQRVFREAPAADLDARLRYAFLLATCRPPESAEVEALRALYTDAQATYASGGEVAVAMATEPKEPLRTADDSADLAAWTVVNNVLLNLDEVLTKR